MCLEPDRLPPITAQQDKKFLFNLALSRDSAITTQLLLLFIDLSNEKQASSKHENVG